MQPSTAPPDRLRSDLPRVGYVLKMYPRLSETFIVTEILAHERAGLPLDLFSLRPPIDGRFHSELAQVQAPVTYLLESGQRASSLWQTLGVAATEFPTGRDLLVEGEHASAIEIMQSIALAREVRTRGIDHLHAHFATTATTVARIAAQLAGITYSFTAHAKDIFHEDVDPDALRRMLRDASSVVTVSEFNLDYLRSRYGKDATNVRCVYNGLDMTQFSCDAGRRPGRLILGVGRLVEKKGFADLIDACAVLVQRGEDVRCEILGGGALEPELQARIEARGLQDHVALLGARSRTEVIERLRDAAVLAAPCVEAADGNRDGLPTVLLEAMAIGIPCVSTAVTGIPEVVRDGETGLLLAPGDPGALAAALARMLDEPGLAARCSANARGLMESSFDIHLNTRRMRELFAVPHGVEPPLATEVA